MKKLKSLINYLKRDSKYALMLFGIIVLISCCSVKREPRVVLIQPFEDVDSSTIELLQQQLNEIFSTVIVSSKKQLPASAYFAARHRYRADSIIQQHKRATGKDTVILAITHHDISTTKDNHKDWGVMGLAISPGNSCIVSDFRAGKPRNKIHLFKLALHELGHTEGLPHCKQQSCYLRSAEGKNHLDQLDDFCNDCKKYLRNRGWNLR